MKQMPVLHGNSARDGYFSPVRISRTETPSVLQRLANISVRRRLFMSAYFPTVRGDMPGFFCVIGLYAMVFRIRFRISWILIV